MTTTDDTKNYADDFSKANKLEVLEKLWAENTALKQKLEKAHMDVANAEHNVAENIKQEVMMWIDKYKALEQKLVAVRKWADTRQADSVVKLRKILDGEGR